MIVGLLVLARRDRPRPATAATTPAETVRAEVWADDVCGTVGAWQGQLKDIREELRHNNWAARRSDGSSGDSQEQVVTVHDAVDRAMRATQETLQEGLKRAGIPDVGQGEQASLIVRQWAERTELQPPRRQGADQAAADLGRRGVRLARAADHGARAVGGRRPRGDRQGRGARP